jgi:WD40 repeat protein
MVLAWLSAAATLHAQWTWDGERPSARQPSAAFSPDGKALAVLDGKGTIRIFDVATGKEGKKVTPALGPGEVAERVSYTSTGELVVMLCQYKGFKFEAGMATQGTISACVWNCHSGKRLPFIEIGYGGVAVCPKGELLAYGDGLWEIATGKKLRKIALPGGLVSEIRFSPDGKTVLYQISESLAQDFSLLFLADVGTGKQVLQIGEIDLDKQGGRCSFFFGAMFSADGKQLAFSAVDRPALHLWDVPGGKALHRIALEESERVVGFSPDTKALISWHQASGSVRLWEVATGKERHAVKLASGVEAVLLAPGAPRVALFKGNAVEFRRLTE